MEGTKIMKNIFVWLFFVFIVVTGWLLTPVSFWKYIFFLRVPIVMGLLLILLPAIAEFLLPAMLKNLFVMRGVFQMAFTILGATVAGIAVTLVNLIIWENAPARFGVASLPAIPVFWDYGVAIALALPTTAAITDLSQEEMEGEKWQGIEKRWWGFFLGISLSLVFLFLFNWIYAWLTNQKFLSEVLSQLLVFVTKNAPEGYFNPGTGNIENAHVNAFVFFLSLLVVYGVIFKLYKPDLQQKKGKAAALTYVMLLIAIASLFLGSLTFYFDYFRVSVLFFWLLISFGMYWLFQVDHFFTLKPDQRQNKHHDPELQDWKKVINKRLENRGAYSTEKQQRTMVIVCASGGGIQAAGWTTQVLTGLQELLGESFTQAITLISAVSGGAVGTMYYLDRFESHGFPPHSQLENIFKSATEDGLDAVGWGLAYPDLWRMIGLPLFPSILTPEISDRGIALELNWQGEMEQPHHPKTLATWREQIFQGEIPIPIFNATLVEDGFRLLITPMTLGSSSDLKYFDFNSLYSNYDIDVVTAARLSATFPYVSPICRGNQGDPKYHIADGGFFDNSGFVTAVQWLNQWLNPKEELNIKRVLLLQINAFPPSSPTNQFSKNSGWLMTTLGPLLTVLQVRDSILNSRNLTEVELLQKQWQEVNVLEQICREQQIELEYFPIFFPSQEEAPAFYNQQGDYQPPLSWNLTTKEKNAIKDGWKAITNKETIQAIKNLWQRWEMD
ncbi:MAG: patatin-like phospholipase family protein [Gomphosphaeria aponina SAG 52.96 = DSM 107014]|uniref:Patatin-like phospholipase family protein n=1 Tax=Gomphosphaeria aponina SAG 52.96 = DSM 107014 TaxID=1521640 RepID=A0A941GQZ9_9CHRO|nr:patatin-like phospholipase family protein [Gomphosphaeria aponina SAG 52.96 = DSM 107014]